MTTYTRKFHIAGVKFRLGAAEHLESIEHGAPMAVEADPENEFDRNAVKVMHGDQHVGFIPKGPNVEVGAMIAENRIVAVTKRTGQSVQIEYRAEVQADE
ncbi:HIRAN domain-containing protein [Parvibaculum sp.]|uniref:HIRAN domain-containing protein n=1 Tax=Parvibaculum sp. TaxID=2024848 RepID=UPI001DD8A05B|nr:HIRAN domain-containing protein [Parvibaculum sp.]MBX3490858.1 hypothetical protein [Parvibaculum sp.]